ncbi:MAG TPA: metallophosphoesterase [Chitinophagaceae bacterium]|nr:metallophosphoesterase [Chitinophagaceae bacterium]
MFKTNALLVTALFACCLDQNADNGSPMHKQSNETMVIDGPYVLYRNDSVFVKYVEDNSGVKSARTDSMPVTMKDKIILSVNTDEAGKTFSVVLKSKLTNEKAEYNGVKNMLVISDIEGNFAALRKLLQGNGVIDENFNWTFEKNHLVLTGDFVDRGATVMEVLWLIYSLEEKARAAGGHVHFILGNHEIMNMSGDLRYVHERYSQHAAIINKNYMQLFGPDAEIGRWLATKNIAERIGDILFTHGGISSYVNNLKIPLKEINEISRPFYTDTTYEYKDSRLGVLFSDFGPFWYRGYYKDIPKATAAQIDSTLEFYNIRHIATGHTIVAENISTLYNGRIINTDVHHADGHSEALLVEKGKFSRVNAAGERFPVIQLKTSD